MTKQEFENQGIEMHPETWKCHRVGEYAVNSYDITSAQIKRIFQI